MSDGDGTALRALRACLRASDLLPYATRAVQKLMALSDPVLSSNSSAFQDAPAASLVEFSPLANAPVLGGTEGDEWRPRVGLDGSLRHRNRGAAAVSPSARGLGP